MYMKFSKPIFKTIHLFAELKMLTVTILNEFSPKNEAYAFKWILIIYFFSKLVNTLNILSLVNKELEWEWERKREGKKEREGGRERDRASAKELELLFINFGESFMFGKNLYFARTFDIPLLSVYPRKRC